MVGLCRSHNGTHTVAKSIEAKVVNEIEQK